MGGRRAWLFTLGCRCLQLFSVCLGWYLRVRSRLAKLCAQAPLDHFVRSFDAHLLMFEHAAFHNELGHQIFQHLYDAGRHEVVAGSLRCTYDGASSGASTNASITLPEKLNKFAYGRTIFSSTPQLLFPTYLRTRFSSCALCHNLHSMHPCRCLPVAHRNRNASLM